MAKKTTAQRLDELEEKLNQQSATPAPQSHSMHSDIRLSQVETLVRQVAAVVDHNVKAGLLHQPQ